MKQNIIMKPNKNGTPVIGYNSTTIILSDKWYSNIHKDNVIEYLNNNNSNSIVNLK